MADDGIRAAGDELRGFGDGEVNRKHLAEVLKTFSANKCPKETDTPSEKRERIDTKGKNYAATPEHLS
jgi:hypothetical protein